MSKQSIRVSLGPASLARLDELARETRKSRSWLISKAVESFLEELDDVRMAQERLHEERLNPSEIRKIMR